MGKISEKRIKELIQELKNVKSLKDSNKKSPRYWYNQKQNVVSSNISTELIKEFLDEYNRIKNNSPSIEKVDTDDRANVEIERDEEGNIEYYKFEIFRRDNTPIVGKFNREEMSLVYRLYSYYGASLTQRIVSRNFPEYSLVDFKRILRCFNITKASSPFAPHEIEENTEEELYEIQSRIKENNILRRIEKDEVLEYKKLVNKLAQENLEYKNILNDINDIKVNITGEFTPVEKIEPNPGNPSIIIHLSDLHIGAKCESNTLYPNKWDREELDRRLNVLSDKIHNLGHFNTLILNLLGDNLDGMDNQTARRDHFMPQNMDNMEQITVFIESLTKFIFKIKDCADKMMIYSVKDGNHDGITGYVSTLALLNVIKSLAPEIDFLLFKDFIGKYEFNGHTYLLCHGKDDKFMKRGLPLTLNDKSKVMIYEWLEANDIHGDNIHFVKGDLHSNELNSCKRFDYRNVLSLFGASDYSNYNFSRNSYGVSYDLFIGNVRTIGTFENF